MAPRIKKSAKRPPSIFDDDGTPLTYPWPRAEGTEIDVHDPKIPPHSLDRWDRSDSRHYNALLGVPIQPTRFIHAPSLEALGINDDVRAVLLAIGVDEICYQTHALYPDLVRQFLASVHIAHSNPDHPTFANASLCFFANGDKHTVTLDEFSSLYSFDSETTELKFSNKFKPSQTFWDLIAVGQFKSRTANQSSIRNPILRVVAKVLSTLIFTKECNSRVTNGELQFLYLGIEDEIRAGAPHIPHATVPTHPGYIFAKSLTEKKERALQHQGTRTAERCGSLLTPLFDHCDVDLTHYMVNPAPEYIDLPYLITCQILRDESTYWFQDRDGNALFCTLPQQPITNLQNFDNIRFLPGPEHLCADPRAAPSEQDDDVQEVEDVTPSPYDLGPLADDADEAAYRRWVVDSHRKNNSLMQRILRKLTGGCLGRPPTGARKKGARPPQRSPGEGTSTAGERLGRNRRSADQFDSEDTD